MAKTVKIEIETDMDDILNRFNELVDDGIPQMVKQYARLLCVQLSARTQPFSVGEKSGGAKNSGAYKQSAKRVKWDIEQIIRDNKQMMKIADGLWSEKLREYMRISIERGDNGAVAEIMSRTGIVIGKGEKVNLVRNSAQYKSAHSKGRSKATGRAFKRVFDFNVANKQGALDGYIRKVQKNIGFAKAGWADAARKVGFGKGDGARGIPSWAKSKSHGQNGHATDLTADKANPRVVIGNSVSYVRRILPDAEIDIAHEWTSSKFIEHLTHKFNAISRKQEREAGTLIEEPF
jgi:hypothetical protein